MLNVLILMDALACTYHFTIYSKLPVNLAPVHRLYIVSLSAFFETLLASKRGRSN